MVNCGNLFINYQRRLDFGSRRGVLQYAPTVKFAINGILCWSRRGVQLYTPTVRCEMNGSSNDSLSMKGGA